MTNNPFAEALAGANSRIDTRNSRVQGQEQKLKAAEPNQISLFNQKERQQQLEYAARITKTQEQISALKAELIPSAKGLNSQEITRTLHSETAVESIEGAPGFIIFFQNLRLTIQNMLARANSGATWLETMGRKQTARGMTRDIHGSMNKLDQNVGGTGKHTGQ